VSRLPAQTKVLAQRLALLEERLGRQEAAATEAEEEQPSALPGVGRR
jgi:hypothetical protein